jgi:hypothetical protein
VAQSLGSPDQTFEDIDPPGLLGTESLRIPGSVSYRAKLSALWSRGSWPNYSRMWSCAIWDFERWSSHASLPIWFWLNVRAIRWCSHLDRLCEVFRSWGGKTCGTLIDRSHDAQPELGDTSGVVTSTRIGKRDQSRDIRLESYLPTRLRKWPESWHTHILSTQSSMYNG